VLSKLEIIQQRWLEEIGGYLCQIRQEKGISLDRVVQHTKIQRYQLVAVETGDLKKLPSAVYLRGFIKIYADFLDCDGRNLASTFPVEFPIEEEVNELQPLINGEIERCSDSTSTIRR
jgi:cytoskeletal protein RodZ